MTQFEFYKSFQFVFELLLAELIFTYRLQRKKLFPLRLIAGIAATFLFAFLFPVPVSNAFYCSFTFLAIFLFSVLAVKFAFKVTWLTVIFCCLAGYTTQHVAYETYTLLLNLLGVNSGSMGFYGNEYVGLFSNLFITAAYFFVYVLSYFVCSIFFGEKLGRIERVELKGTFIFVFVIFILIIDIVLNAVIVYYVASDGKPLYLIIMGFYNILCCYTALYLQFEVALKKQLESTLATVKQLWHQAKEQYTFSKENIEMINVKCHDLKHQIRRLGKENLICESVAKDLEQRISIYDSEVKTGNVALDIILTEKSVLCNKYGIKFSCIVDGAALSFMAEEDIYALFGNIVDNAIEAVRKVEQTKRVISLQVKRTGDLLMIKETNYYDDEIQFEYGMPKTTKDDKQYHGFGLRSIQLICENYGGNLMLKAEEKTFTLSILFFMGESEVQSGEQARK